MTHSENANHFAEYVEKMRQLEVQIKLVAYHTLEAAKQTEKAADYTLLAAYYAKEAFHEKR